MSYYIHIDSLGGDKYRARVTEKLPHPDADKDEEKADMALHWANGDELLRFDFRSPFTSSADLYQVAELEALTRQPALADP